MVAGAEVSSSSEDSWVSLAPMPTARMQFGAAAADGKIFAIGGQDGIGRYLSTNEMYDPVSNTWVKRTSMPTPRVNFGIAVYDNKIYVIGGAIGVDPSGNGNALKTAANEVYDPITDTWETKASLPTPRHGLTATVANGKIYAISGVEQGSYRGLDYGSVKNEVYDPETDTWTTEPSIPNGVFHAVSATVDDKIYVLGGAEASLGISGWSNFNQVYDTEQKTWTSASPVPVGVDGAAGGVTTEAFMSTRICVFGGFTDASYEACNLTQIYNPDKNVWVTGAQMPTPHALFGVANVNDELYAIGGSPGDAKPLNKATEKYQATKITGHISVLSPQNKTYEGNSVPLDFTIDNPTSWVGYRLDGQETVTVAGNATITGITIGLHNITVYATDVYGKTGASETVFFSISEPFTLVPVAIASVAVAVGVAGMLVYLKKRKH